MIVRLSARTFTDVMAESQTATVYKLVIFDQLLHYITYFRVH